MERAQLDGIELEYELRGNGEPFVVPNATHLLEVENPRGVAEGLVGFFARHPLTVPA
jgi:hypothetical protein